MNKDEIISGLQTLLNRSREQAGRLEVWIQDDSGDEEMLEFRRAVLPRVREEIHLLEATIGYLTQA